ncbi:ADP-ribosylation factor-like protein 2 [Nematocida parisii]|nr:ADP-ribosylation factor-like protein 2 [Nematocida parisii]KAI5155669.1 ADP-ribosylation factor-like protein 2 [Nematocida parisii]
MRFAAIIKKVLEKDRRLKIVILGPDNAGKTSLLRAYLNQNIADIKPTYGYQIVNTEMEVEKNKYEIEILDIGGQKSIRAYWDTYYSGVDGVLFVYDTYGTNEYKKIIENTVSHPTLQDTEFICASNKADDITQEETQQTKYIQITQHNPEIPRTDPGFDFMANTENISENQQNTVNKEIEIIYTSAKNKINVERVFRRLIENILKKQRNAVL